MNNINMEIEEKLIKYILQKKTKTMNLSEVYEKLKLPYTPQSDKIINNILKNLEEKGYIQPLKTTNKNLQGSFEKYKILKLKEENEEKIKEEILKLDKKIKIDYFLKHPKEYMKNKEIIIPINKFIKQTNGRKIETITVNERSYQIYKNEKCLKENEIEGFNVDTENLLENEVFTYKRILEERKKINKVVNKLTTDFSEYINYIKEQVAEFYIKQDVLEKIENLKIPTKLSETKIIGNGITTIIETLEEKIRHIEEALKLLESYQENFITKCFEKAETIVRDLEKLPGLSRIKINGKDTNIIKLDLFEYEKEEKLNKMKEYIYDL